jgi:BirA family biotin operon repressor/biotin-[acetyl-CoA-carboxylase] ligase
MEEKNCKIIHLSEVGSTNDYLKEVINSKDLADGAMVIADHQTAGKGVDKNTWESEAGKNILMSIIFYPDFVPAENQFIISMAVALGISDFLTDQLPAEQIQIKWPNDIYADDRKIAGILITNEILGTKIKHVIVGIGLNVNQVAFSADITNPTSLAILSGRAYNLQEETIRLRDFVTERYEQLRVGSFDLIRNDYYSRLLGINENRKFRYQGNEIDAMITGVDEFGRLQLDTDGGLIVCDLKEISFIS